MEQICINGKPYDVLRLLGKGKGGYSYLVTDGEGEYVLKQIHHEPCSYYTFGDKLASELGDYDRLRALHIPMPEMLEVDRPNERILKQYIDGPTIAQLVTEGGVKLSYFEQVEQMCRILYAAGLNIDYYPTNFVVQDDRLYYIDYECNPYMEQWDFEHWGKGYWTGETSLV